MNYEQSDFYCISCGKRGLPVQRPSSKKRESGHRKKLYCPNCKVVVNHYECKTQEDVDIFIKAFNNGDFEEEAKISKEVCSNAI